MKMVSGRLCVVLSSFILGTSSKSDAEFVGSCPVQESIPGFNLKNISAIGVAVLVNATKDIETFLDIGCDPNFNETFLNYIDNECVNPIFKQLGISCSRVVKNEGFTPLIMAVSQGTAETVKKLAQLPNIKLDAATSNTQSALWLAATSGMLEKVKILVEAGADIEFGGGQYLATSLGVAVTKNFLDVVKYLINKGANANSRSIGGYTPSHFATNLEMLKLLQRAGADLNGVDDNSNSVLTIAVDANEVNIVDFLISQKVNLNRKNSDGYTALYYAASNEYLDVLRSLVRAGADLEILYGNKQFSALSIAILAGNTDSALLMIKNGADVNSRTSEGFTASFVAAQEGNLPVLEALVAAGANLELPGGAYEMTPLLIAAIKGELDIVKFLKKNGVNLEVKDSDRKSALDLAKENGFDEIVMLLEEK